MPKEADEIRDRQHIYLQRFDKIVRDRLKTLITEELIDAHRRNPTGPHSDALERVLNYFRRAAVTGKYAILTMRPFAAYRVVALSGRRGVAPHTVDDQVYTSVAEAQHAVFLRRIHDLMKS